MFGTTPLFEGFKSVDIFEISALLWFENILDYHKIQHVGCWFDPDIEKLVALKPDIVLGLQSAHNQIKLRLESERKSGSGKAQFPWPVLELTE